MTKTVLLLGSLSHPEIQLLNDKLQNAAEVIIVDTSALSEQFQLSWSAKKYSGILHTPSKDYTFDEIDAAFWFRFALPGACNASIQSQKEHTAMLNTLLSCQSVRWCNSLAAIRYHQQKPVQLAHARQLGVTIPPTYIGNNVHQAWEFVQSHEHIIVKPVHGGQFTSQLARAAITKTDLQHILAPAPITLQRYIAGTNIRTFVVQDTVISAEIRSDTTDFRTDNNAKLLPHTLPRKTAQLARNLCRAFGMTWTAIDWRYTPEGDYLFLEANPAPCFSEFENQSRQAVSDLLVKLLLANTNTKT